eukprot:COSAG06_NODE_10252_length_1718_cov_16.093267_2_plen_121_part_00
MSSGVVAEYNDIDMCFIMSMSTQHSLSAKLTKQRAFPPDAPAVFLQEDLFFEDLTVLSALRLEHRADSKVLLLSGGERASRWCAKRICCAIFVLRIIILPRQARDKHRERSGGGSAARGL